MGELLNITNSPFGGIAGLIYAIVVIYFIVLIVQSSMDVLTKIIWILVVVFIPLIGPILYYVLGRKG